MADDASFNRTSDPTRPTRILTRPSQRPGQRSTTRPGQQPDPTRSTVRPGPVNGQPGQRSNPTRSTQPRPCCMRCHALPHAPNLLVAREGACEGISGQFWYLQIRIEIPYNVVYRLGMFEAFTDMKMRVKPYIRLDIRVFSRIFVFLYGFRKYIR